VTLAFRLLVRLLYQQYKFMINEAPIPLYYQIFDYLQRRLYNNEFARGEKLPSETELASDFGVSRITARKALSEMERKGFVTRQRGRGTYVATQFEAPDFPKLVGSLNDLFLIARATVLKESSIEQVVAHPKVKAALLLRGSNPTVTKIQRVLCLNSRPFAYLQNFYPQSIGKNITREDVLKYPLLEILEQKLHTPVIEVHQIIEATVADREIADRLEISFGSPLLHGERTILTGKKVPIGFVDAYYRGDSYHLSVTLVRSTGESSQEWRPLP
jgi:GntR family transcriptional regulator